jgi:intergrase/recombinase
LFSRVEHGKRALVLALRILFSYYEVLGLNGEWLDSLRKALLKVRCGIDLKVPSENEVLDSLRRLVKAPLKYRALWNLLLNNGV